MLALCVQFGRELMKIGEIRTSSSEHLVIGGEIDRV
jgi:hypothetical protein